VIRRRMQMQGMKKSRGGGKQTKEITNMFQGL
jgi:hypothetical protein